MFRLTAAQSSSATAADILLGILGLAVIVTLVVLYYRRRGLKGTTRGVGRSILSPSAINIKPIDERELDGLLASIGSTLASQGFVPQGGTPGLYVFQKEKKPSILLTILLLLLWIIPGIIYLIWGWKKTVVAIQVVDLPLKLDLDEGSRSEVNACYTIGVKGPADIRRWVINSFAPYALDLDHLQEHPEETLLGKEFEKRVQVDCEHCGHLQEVVIPYTIERVEEGVGYSSGGSKTVICINPECNKPFDITWDRIIIEIELT